MTLGVRACSKEKNLDLFLILFLSNLAKILTNTEKAMLSNPHCYDQVVIQINVRKLKGKVLIVSDQNQQNSHKTLRRLFIERHPGGLPLI